jgi:hypothetical protein
MSSRYSPDPAKKYILSILAAPTAITVDLKVFIWLSSLTTGSFSAHNKSFQELYVCRRRHPRDRDHRYDNAV